MHVPGFRVVVFKAGIWAYMARKDLDPYGAKLLGNVPCTHIETLKHKA